MCTARFLYYFSVYVNLFKELFSLSACRCISEKRVQWYREFQYPPNLSRIIFQKLSIIDMNQGKWGKKGRLWSFLDDFRRDWRF